MDGNRLWIALTMTLITFAGCKNREPETRQKLHGEALHFQLHQQLKLAHRQQPYGWESTRSRRNERAR